MNVLQYCLYRIFRWLYMNIFGMKPGAYIQDPKNTIFGENVQLSHGTQIYTRNHRIDEPLSLDKTEMVFIGKDSWVGANAIILPGVILGPHTIVGAGSIVTHSFPDGWCVIAGNPAKVIRGIQKNEY